MIPTNKKYQIIYADPPWSYNDKMSGHSFSLENKYKTQSKDWIANLPVGGVVDDNCVLFLWAVSPLLPEAFEVMRAWGFKYKTVAFVWSKRHKDGTPVSNLGRWTMGNIEMCLLGTKGKPQRKIKTVKQFVEDYRAEHSRKPDVFRSLIITLMGDLPRLEMFARDKGENLFNENNLDGWDVFGDECKNSINL